MFMTIVNAAKAGLAEASGQVMARSVARPSATGIERDVGEHAAGPPGVRASAPTLSREAGG